MLSKTKHTHSANITITLGGHFCQLENVKIYCVYAACNVAQIPQTLAYLTNCIKGDREGRVEERVEERVGKSKANTE